VTARTTLVLLPGLDGTEIFFGPLLVHLPAWIDPVVVAYPSSGPNAYDDLLAIANRELSSRRDFVVLGWSFGGPLALMVAERMRSQVSGVILCNSFVSSPRPRLALFRFAAMTPVIATVRALRRARFLVPGYADGALRKAKAKTWKRVNAQALAARSRAALGVDVRSLLARSGVPVMYLASTQDEVISRRSLDEVLALAPQTEVTEVDGPHMALFSNPAQSAARIVDFLQRIGEKRRLKSGAGLRRSVSG
jgi:pimeloyl-ACP methyl ester carboxylesterase